ncbi:MAG: DMT family transporter [Rhodobacteraceae bacterium]|nr:DMT family transporter [Paracoccaceae bacterium]
MTGRAGLVALLVLLGAAWGATQPLTKIAVSTGHGPLGLIFWQLLIGAVLLGALLAALGRGLPLHRRALAFYLLIALIGTILPNTASYLAARDLPAGVLAIVIALVPILAFPVALALGTDRFSGPRLAGLVLGLLGVALIALPETSLPDRAMLAALPVALAAPLLYAIEGNVVARWGTAGCDAIQTLCGASAVGAAVTLPLALASGQFIDPRAGFGAPELALVLSSLLHGPAYAAYVWMIGRAGAVFAAQVSYLVTGFGIGWSMLLLGESYSGWIWLALAAMMGGLFLVQPRPREGLAAPAPAVNDGHRAP